MLPKRSISHPRRVGLYPCPVGTLPRGLTIQYPLVYTAPYHKENYMEELIGLVILFGIIALLGAPLWVAFIATLVIGSFL